jgi:hypothetical protein
MVFPLRVSPFSRNRDAYASWHPMRTTRRSTRPLASLTCLAILSIPSCGGARSETSEPLRLQAHVVQARAYGPPPYAVGAQAAPASPAPFLHDVAQLAVGSAHVCAVTTSHAVFCWGDNSVGQLGVGRDGRSVAVSLSRPHQVGAPPVASVAAGHMHTCAIDLGGSVLCWGSEGADLVVTPGGAAGSIELHGKALGAPVHMPLGGGEAHLVALSNMSSTACAAFADEVRCWSTFQAISIDAHAVPPSSIQRTRIAGVTALALGHGKVCAVAEARLWCWSGQQAPTPAAWARGDSFVPIKVAIGEMYACAISASGDVRCWWSLIDDFWRKPPNREVRWPTKLPTRAIAVGDSPICTLDAAGTIDCFLSEEGGLPEEAALSSWATKSLGPHPIAGIDRAIDLGLGLGRNVMGYGFGCALREVPDSSGAQVFCWGENESGQLGTGDETSTKVAVPVLGATL